MATLYIIDMGGNRAIATNEKDAIKQGYKWADFGATIWKVTTSPKKIVKYGWVLELPKWDLGKSNNVKLHVFFKTGQNGIDPVSVHGVGTDGSVSPKVNVLDKKYRLYFGNEYMFRDNTDRPLPTAKLEKMAVEKLYHRCQNINRY